MVWKPPQNLFQQPQEQPADPRVIFPQGCNFFPYECPPGPPRPPGPIFPTSVNKIYKINFVDNSVSTIDGNTNTVNSHFFTQAYVNGLTN